MRGKHLIPTIFLVHEACSDRMRIAKNMFSLFCDGVVHSDRIEQSRTFVHLCRGEWQHVDTTCDDAGHPCLPYHLPQHQHLRDVLSSWCHKLSFDKYDKHAQNMFQKTLDTKWYKLESSCRAFLEVCRHICEITKWTCHSCHSLHFYTFIVATEVVLMAALLLLPRRLSALLSATR